MREDELKIPIEEWLLSWFVARAKIKKELLEKQKDTLRKADFFDAGWLTSMQVVELVIEIERKFHMQFSDRDLQDQRFATIAGLTEIVLERSTQTCETASL